MPAAADRSPEQERARFRAGMRDGVPYALAGMLVAVSYGVLAKPVLGSAAPIVMSAVVFAGSAQFASLAVLAAGGGAATAIAAGLLLNLRFLPMGIAVAPSMVHGALGRAARGQALVDASWALSNRGGGRFDISALLGATAVQYVTWNLGTVLGVLAGGVLGDPSRIGLDAVYPAFFLGLLVTELRRPGARLISLTGATIALALTPVLPAGVPILAAAAAATLGLRS
ncbi:MAG TPA: AzlC family ABC transporter permease [Solirubrobacteraceae bacterium]|nr:AzlC family ABC transporter permease [Solirubrobacteraceae bacterium]